MAERFGFTGPRTILPGLLPEMQDPNVKIELLKGGSVYRTLANTLNDGSCSWTLLDAEGTGGDYRVRITSATNAAITDTSNGYFTITSPNPPSSITVTSPNGGEIWVQRVHSRYYLGLFRGSRIQRED